MTGRLKLRLFAHSWTSDWNHGNAHFLRGLACELVKLGHDVRCYEQLNSWSLCNLLKEDPAKGRAAIDSFWTSFPELDVRFFDPHLNFRQFAAEELSDADIVLLHEWNAPSVVKTILDLKNKFRFRVLFHDTHHRAYTSPQEILKLNLKAFDGVLVFGEALRRIYEQAFGVERIWIFHEAADIAHFVPVNLNRTTDVVWIGNWGDEERTRELEEFLLGPTTALKNPKVAVHGVRYPDEARARLAEAGVEYRGYLPNLRTPQVYGESLITLHVPRRYYANGLSGIPTIRVFEALACGIPLVCSPWLDTEGLFRAGEDFVCVKDGKAMAAELRHLLQDEKARQQMAERGLQTVRQRHTCAHRARQLLEICEELGR
ncbi:MAG TPA: glycosyltransferase [Terriglobales bacterium]|nr:glycosyltransferase [Terriglobales bacterium]